MRTGTPAVPVTGVWFRHVRAGGSPMPVRPAPDGRWQRGEQLAGLYLAADPDTVWAEWYRARAELGEPPDTWLPRDRWRFSLNLQRVADLSRPAALRALGLPNLKPDRGSGRRSRTPVPGLRPTGSRVCCSDRAPAPLGSASVCSRPLRTLPGSAPWRAPSGSARHPRRRAGCAPSARSPQRRAQT